MSTIHEGWLAQEKPRPQAPKRPTRICIECDREFVSPYPKQTMCTKHCRDQRALRIAREKRAAAKPQSVSWLPSIDLRAAKEDMPQWIQPNTERKKQQCDGIGKAQMAEVKRVFRERRGRTAQHSTDAGPQEGSA